MKLIFKQRFFSWFDSYDVYDEKDELVYKVSGQPALTHTLEVCDRKNVIQAVLKQKLFSFLSRFDILIGGETTGTITRNFSFLKPSFSVDAGGWKVEGDFWEWNYRILSPSGALIAQIEKQIFRLTDTYTIDIKDDKDALMVLMVVLAIDAARCSDGKD